MEEISNEFDIGGVSRFNSGALINMRLNNLWNDAHNHKRKGKYASWNGDLDAVWCELVGDVKEGSPKDKDFDKINGDLAKLAPIRNWDVVHGFNKTNSTIQLKQQLQYAQLIKKEAFLRRLQNKQGKGTAYDQEDDWE
jgi:hypothetical protein